MEWLTQKGRRASQVSEFVGLTLGEVTELVGQRRLRVIDTNRIETAGGRMFLMSDLRHHRVNVLAQDARYEPRQKF